MECMGEGMEGSRFWEKWEYHALEWKERTRSQLSGQDQEFSSVHGARKCVPEKLAGK